MNEKIAVIGGGQMGSQIAALAAMAGYETSLYDENVENLEYRYKFVEENIKNLIDKKIYSEDKLDAYKKNLELKFTLEEVIHEKSFVIEAVVERFDIKLEIFKKISNLMNEEVVMATNSSFIQASELSKHCNHPERFINMHFFYPPIRMDLVEISYPDNVSKDVLERTKTVSKNMGRSVVVLKKETPGFIVNRMLAALVDEAYELYDEGIADFEDIDIAIKKGLNHPLGPFELSDYSGLDIHYYAKLKKFKESGNAKDEPKKFLEEKVLNGDLGVKTGKGFYEYKKD
jgi:3-hydroxybutyryl-CoA dehydrogenase